jgi:vacuolar-type H+-ATPase subunit C/Vma6
LGDLLREAGVVSEIATRRGANALERELRRRAGVLLGSLTPWAGARSRYLSILLEDEDRRSVSTIVRGTVQGVPASVKTAGLVPTELLPERALESLAARNRIAEIGGLLSLWQHPFAPALGLIASQAQPDLFVFERAVDRIFLDRARVAAKRAGRRVRDFVTNSIDLHNAFAAFILTNRGGDVDAASMFIEGGRHLTVGEFVSVAKSTSNTEAEHSLRTALSDSILQPVFSMDADGPRSHEGRALRLLLRHYKDLSRLDPVGAAPVLRFALRVRAEAIDLRRIIAGLTIGAPAGDIARDLVTLP